MGVPRGDWVVWAACRDADPELFFYPEGERAIDKRRRDTIAKAVCARCKVFDQCSNYTNAINPKYGLWAGSTEDEREEKNT